VRRLGLFLDPRPATLYIRSVSYDIDLLMLELAKRFAAHDMQQHLAQLRRLYRDRRQRLCAAAKAKLAPWDESMVVEWACLLRIAPFDNVYPVRASHLCPNTPGCPVGAVHTENIFPGGHLMLCNVCGSRWLVPATRP
jgi:hypothetical protein